MNTIIAVTLAVLMNHPTEPYYTDRRGVDGPSGFIWRSHEYLVLRMPSLDFTKELEALLDTELSQTPWGGGETEKSEAAERKDAEDALAAGGVEGDARLEALDALAAARRALPEMDEEKIGLWGWEGPKSGALTEETAKADPDLPDVDFAPYESFVEHLPGEFLLYLKGAAAYRQQKYREAIRHWDMLLKYPPNAREYKSTWAAFMLGKAWLHLDTRRAIPCFEKVRALADGGFRDTLGLRTASLGWQAFAELQTGAPTAGIRHYAEQYKTGTRMEQESAFHSFYYAIKALFNEEELPDSAFDDPLVREIVTLALLSRRGPDRAPRTWAVNLETRRPEIAKGMSNWMSMLYFMDSEYVNAEEWAVRAPDDEFFAKWVDLKGNLRASYFYPYGYEYDPLIERYRSLLAEGDPRALRYPEFEFALFNERGIVQLNRGEFVPALLSFLEGKNNGDAAYIAECILTSDELAGVLPQLPVSSATPVENRLSGTLMTPRDLLSGVLARKLAREGRFIEAAAFGSEKAYKDLAKTLAEGRDQDLEKRTRAENLFLAGTLVRERGMELLGTQFAPDWKLYHGTLIPRGQDRLEAGAARPVEAMRINSNRPFPNRRFHYKWKAADLMWECAQLLPNNDDLLAQALWYGGTYIAIEGPEGADKFYKALVRRCGKLPIGQEADQRRWFPPRPVDWPYPADRVWN